MTLNPWKPRYKNIKIYRYKHDKHKEYIKECEGFDTETDNGYARIIASSEGWGEVKSLSDCLRFMSGHRFRNRYNCWWNLNFDIEGILKHDAHTAEEISEYGEGCYDKYRLRFIPKKMFKISSDSKNTVYHYDISQFYGSSLKNAAKLYLGRIAPEIKEDRDNLWAHPISEIGNYCRWDATATRDLAARFVRNLYKIPLKPRHLISAGHLAQTYLMNFSPPPTANDVPPRVNHAYWEAFHGGWFDCYKRGSFLGYQYDISSAYPYHMRNFPDLRDGEWINKADPDKDFGVMRVSLETKDSSLCPIAVWSGYKNIYPDFDIPYRCFITNSEYRAIESLYDISIEWGYYFKENDRCRRPFKIPVDTLYAFKQNLSAEPGAYEVSKHIINSLYGKSAERRKSGDTFTGGLLFCPPYAAETTARTRAQVIEFVKQYHKSIATISTDGIITDSPINFVTSGGLGGWKIEQNKTPVLIVRSGIYQFKEVKAHTRGFPRSYDLFKECDIDNSILQVTHRRPTHLKEALVRRDFNSINVFKDYTKDISLNIEKRIWMDSPGSFRELLNKKYVSVPVPYSLLG